MQQSNKKEMLGVLMFCIILIFTSGILIENHRVSLENESREKLKEVVDFKKIATQWSFDKVYSNKNYRLYDFAENQAHFKVTSLQYNDGIHKKYWVTNALRVVAPEGKPSQVSESIQYSIIILIDTNGTVTELYNSLVNPQSEFLTAYNKVD